jgi:SAM-dependent methyltransferase
MMPMDPETERVRVIYDRRGLTMAPGDRSFLFGDARAWLASRASGDTLEVGIGAGRTLAYYPAEVRLTGIDPSPVMLSAARAQAAALGREVSLRRGDAMALELPDQSFDTVVFCLVLCTVPDDRRRSLRRRGSCGPVVASSRWSTSAARTLSSGSSSVCGSRSRSDTMAITSCAIPSTT